MKKSNKLLLGGFLMVMLFIIGIHIALYAKYKSGDYSLVPAYHPEKMEETEMQQFQDVRIVRLRNVFFATVYFGDSAAVEKGKEGLIRYEQRGDSLFITGKYYNEDQPEGKTRLNITIP